MTDNASKYADLINAHISVIVSATGVNVDDLSAERKRNTANAVADAFEAGLRLGANAALQGIRDAL